MSISSTRETICKKISEDFDALLQPAKSTQAVTKRQISDAKTQLKNASFSSDTAINNAIGDLDNEVKGAIPSGDSDDLDEITDFISSCDYLKDNSLLNNPIALLNGATKSVIDDVKGFVDDISSSVPEFGIGQLISEVQDKLSGLVEGFKLPGSLDLTTILQTADKLINCVVSRCGPNYSSRVSQMIDDLQGIYDDLQIDDDPLSSTWGQLDVQQIYSDAGISATNIAKMDKVVDAVNKSKSDAFGGISSLKSKIKSASNTVTGLF